MAWAILKMCCSAPAPQVSWGRGRLGGSARPKELCQCRHFSGVVSASLFLPKQTVSANKAFPKPSFPVAVGAWAKG